MGQVLGDGTIVPSYLQVNDEPSRGGYEISTNDNSLRVGRVLKVHNPSDKTNTNGSFFEYDVKVEFMDSTGTHRRIIYPRCRMSQLHGGAADYLRFTPRVVEGQDKDPTDLGLGSMVLVLCINGNRRDAVIIGGFPHPKVAPDDPSLGHNLHFNFNGIDFIINKDGELALTFTGATKSDGSLTDNAHPSAKGTQAEFQLDGSFVISTPGVDQSFKINHTNKQMELSTNNILNIQAGIGVHVNKATDAWVKGTTWRAAEAVRHAQMIAGLGVLSSQAAAAGVALVTAGALMVAPVVGAVAAAVPIGTAGGILSSMVGTIAQLIAALSTYEGGQATYLSFSHFAD